MKKYHCATWHAFCACKTRAKRDYAILPIPSIPPNLANLANLSVLVILAILTNLTILSNLSFLVILTILAISAFRPSSSTTSYHVAVPAPAPVITGTCQYSIYSTPPRSRQRQHHAVGRSGGSSLRLISFSSTRLIGSCASTIFIRPFRTECKQHNTIGPEGPVGYFLPS